MSDTECIWCVCADCAAEFSLSDVHLCDGMLRRRGVQLIENLITEVDDPTGLLALYRVMYRLKSTISGLERYADRAALAQRVMRLDGCKTCMDVQVSNK
jgi:hypothetical protein